MPKKPKRTRFSPVTIETVHGVEPTLYIAARNHREALEQVDRPDAKVTAKGNLWLPVTDVYDDGQTFEFNHAGTYITVDASTPGYDHAAKENREITLQYEQAARQAYE